MEIRIQHINEIWKASLIDYDNGTKVVESVETEKGYLELQSLISDAGWLQKLKE